MVLILILSIAIHSAYLGSKIVVSLFALDLGASKLVIGLLAALYGLMPLLLGIYSGRLIDRIGVRWPLIGGAACITLAMLAAWIGKNITALYFTSALAGTGFVFYNVAIQNLTGAYGRPEDRTRNFSWLSIGYSISTFIGPMFAGFSIDHAGHTLTFLFLAAFTIPPIALLLGMRSLTDIKTAKPPAESGSAFDLLGIAPLRRLIITSAMLVAAWELFAFYLPVYAYGIGLSASQIGLILGAFAVAAFTTRFALPTLSRRWSGQQILSGAALTAAVPFVLLPLVKGIWLLMAAAFVIGLGLGCGQPISMMLCYERSPEGRTGEATGLRLAMNNIARVVIPVISGALGAALGTAPVFWANAINLVIISGLVKRR